MGWWAWIYAPWGDCILDEEVKGGTLEDSQSYLNYLNIEEAESLIGESASKATCGMKKS